MKFKVIEKYDDNERIICECEHEADAEKIAELLNIEFDSMGMEYTVR